MLDEIKQIVSEVAFQEDVISFLVDICKVDTTPRSDIRLMAGNEETVFNIIKERLSKFSFEEAIVKEKKISPAIKNHPAFSRLHFTKTNDNPNGLSAETVYRERANLLYFLNGIPSENGKNPAIHAHIDIVAPYFPPERKGDTILGRGVIDDKGGVAAMYGALAVLNRLNREKRIRLQNRITAMFVVEEETGGNGSLDLAIDGELKKRYDSVMIMECAGNKIYPANRGAVWFWCSTTVNPGTRPTSGGYKPFPLESLIFSVLEMQQEGDKIKEESSHPMFPHKPVQTCNGILGPFGEHPSRICGYVAFQIRGVKGEGLHNDLMKCLQTGLEHYIEKYGDKTRYFDKNTGKPRVERHFDVNYNPGNDSMSIKVFGSTGHMGSILEHDAAITKWAYMAREVLLYKINQCPALLLELEDHDSSKPIILEGGQGFLPTHSIETIEERMRNAFARGVKKYLKMTGSKKDSLRCEVTYEKLHNNAFSCDPDSSTFRNARDAGIQAGIIAPDEPVKGWDVSCDARLFAGEHPDMPVITSGPGELHFAHADNEQIFLPDLFNSIVFNALFLLKETGSLSG
jgi:acetylornithine deacetylase/succinyl-diaminopimelate desuccinylase-like protein